MLLRRFFFFVLSLFAFFPLFSIDLVLMHFQCPSVCAGGVGGLSECSLHTHQRNFTLKGSMEGGGLSKESHSSEKLGDFQQAWELAHRDAHTQKTKERWPPTPLVFSILSSENTHRWTCEGCHSPRSWQSHWMWKYPSLFRRAVTSS